MKATVLFNKTKPIMFKLKELVSEWAHEHSRYYANHPRKAVEVSGFHLYAGYTECCTKWLKSYNPINDDCSRQAGIRHHIYIHFNIDIVDVAKHGGLKYVHSWVTSKGNQTHVLVYPGGIEVLVSGRRHGVRRVFLDIDPVGWEYVSSQLPNDASPYETNEEYQERMCSMQV